MARATQVKGLSATSPLSHAAAVLLQARLADLLRAMPKVAGQAEAPPDAEALHDLRVAARRLRVALAFFEAAPKKVLRKLRKLKRRAGEVRDLQLLLARVCAPGRQGAGRAQAEALRPRLEASLQGRLPALRRVLRSFEEDLRPQLAHHVARASPSGVLGGRRLRKQLADRLRRTERLLRAARLLEPEPAHALRKGFKRLRDEAELLAPAFPQALTTLSSLIAPVQEQLGVLHDADVHLALLEEAGLTAQLAKARKERAALARPLLVQLSAWTRAGRLATLAKALRERR